MGGPWASSARRGGVLSALFVPGRAARQYLLWAGRGIVGVALASAPSVLELETFQGDSGVFSGLLEDTCSHCTGDSPRGFSSRALPHLPGPRQGAVAVLQHGRLGGGQ